MYALTLLLPASIPARLAIPKEVPPPPTPPAFWEISPEETEALKLKLAGLEKQRWGKTAKDPVSGHPIGNPLLSDAFSSLKELATCNACTLNFRSCPRTQEAEEDEAELAAKNAFGSFVRSRPVVLDQSPAIGLKLQEPRASPGSLQASRR